MPAGWAAAAAAAAGAYTANKAGKQQDEALNQQQDQLTENRAFIQAQGDQARYDLLPLFDGAAQNRDIGNQAALDIFSQSTPQQFDTFQQGNIGAQQAVLTGAQQYQNAIMGLPVDYGAMQPQAIQYNTDFMPQGMPSFVSAAQSTEDFAPQEVDMRLQDLQQELNTAIQTGGRANRERVPGLRSQIAGLETQREAYNPEESAPLLAGRIKELQGRVDAARTAGGRNNRRLLTSLTPELSGLQARFDALGSSGGDSNIANLLGGVGRGY